jgi:hypothetical protein
VARPSREGVTVWEDLFTQVDPSPLWSGTCHIYVLFPRTGSTTEGHHCRPTNQVRSRTSVLPKLFETSSSAVDPKGDMNIMIG